MEKVILVSIDGMRPDGLMKCGNPYVEKLLNESTYSLNERTVEPSVTLPCHMSMFHSVPPERHGIMTNTYTPMVRPLNGLFEQLKAAGKRCAMYYGWEPLRDISRPASLIASNYINAYSFDNTDKMLTECAIDYIKIAKPDFVFLYMVETDEKGGHDSGWMSDKYLECISSAIDNVKAVVDEFGDEYTIIVTADHGGHERSHGTIMDEDMLVPVIMRGKNFQKGRNFDGGSILNIAPTIADIMEVEPAREWEGISYLEVLNK